MNDILVDATEQGTSLSQVLHPSNLGRVLEDLETQGSVHRHNKVKKILNGKPYTDYPNFVDHEGVKEKDIRDLLKQTDFCFRQGDQRWFIELKATMWS